MNENSQRRGSWRTSGNFKKGSKGNGEIESLRVIDFSLYRMKLKLHNMSCIVEMQKKEISSLKDVLGSERKKHNECITDLSVSALVRRNKRNITVYGLIEGTSNVAARAS